MKWLKDKLFLVLLAGFGAVYLFFLNGWQVYAEPFSEIRAWYQKAVYGQPVFSDNVVDEDQNDSDNGEDETVAVAGDETAPESDPEEGEPAASAAEEVPAADGKDDEEEDIPEDDGFGNGEAPVYMDVEDDYFSDALFIGDSRTVGLYEYGGLEDITTFYASTGLTVYKLFDSEIVEVPGQRQKQSIEQALQENQFKKIYLMIGINEMGRGTVESFTEKYEEVVEHLLELQPDAILYIQGILKVTTERSEQGDYINNEGIEERNEALSQLADNRRIFYLDANPLLCDETGGMDPSYTFDGVHLKAQYVDIWKDYLKSHAVDLDGT